VAPSKGGSFRNIRDVYTLGVNNEITKITKEPDTDGITVCMHAEKYTHLCPVLKELRQYEVHERGWIALSIAKVRLRHRYCGGSGERASKSIREWVP